MPLSIAHNNAVAKIIDGIAMRGVYQILLTD